VVPGAATTTIMACLNNEFGRVAVLVLELPFSRPALPWPAMASRAEEKQEARARRIAAEEAERRSARRRASIMRLGLVVGLAVVAVVVAVVLSSGNGGSSNGDGGGGAKAGDAAGVNALFRGIPQKGLDLGSGAKAPTLMEFVDLQCPYCRQFSDAVLPTVVKRYVRTGRLRYQLHVRSFLGEDSVRAAGAAAVAAQENHLYQFADLFYRRQQEENTGYVTDSFIRGIALPTGVDAGKAVAAAGNPKAQPLVKQAERQAAALGSNGTPDFFLRLRSGRVVKVPAELSADGFTKVLDQALGQT
jgi:protein-disulfide isomerase